ncbi:alpha-N-arabinofuranosidase, partial [Planctomycetota bacterium]
YKIACGAYGENYEWTEVVMEKAGINLMWGLSYHYYCGSGRESRSATEFGEVDWFHLLRNALRMDEFITRHGTIMDEYIDCRRMGNLAQC